MNEIEIIENDSNAKIIVNGQIQKGVKSYKFERKNYDEYELTLILDVDINNSIINIQRYSKKYKCKKI